MQTQTCTVILRVIQQISKRSLTKANTNTKTVPTKISRLASTILAKKKRSKTKNKIKIVIKIIKLLYVKNSDTL